MDDLTKILPRSCGEVSVRERFAFDREGSAVKKEEEDRK